jgi:hypothetical protein
MSTKNNGKSGNAAAPTAATEPQQPGQKSPPPGDDWVAVTSQIDGWFAKEPGIAVTGTIRGRHERGDGKGAYYMLELDAGCRAELAGKVAVNLVAGQFLAVGESHGLRMLDECDGCKVRIEPIKKIPTKSGNDVWVFDVRVARDSVARHEANKRAGVPRTQPAQADAADNIPF